MSRWMALPLVTAAALACGGDAQPAADNPLAQITAAAEQMQKAAENFTSGANRKPVPPVAFRELIEFLPEKLPGLKREEPTGETTAAGNWKYSQADVDFTSEDGKSRADVGIFDYAHIPLLYVPFNMFLNMNISRESTDGYERSMKIEGFPGYEKWGKNGSSEAVALVGDRFIVKAEVRGMGEGAARKIVENIDLKDLASKGK